MFSQKKEIIGIPAIIHMCPVCTLYLQIYMKFYPAVSEEIVIANCDQWHLISEETNKTSTDFLLDE